MLDQLTNPEPVVYQLRVVLRGVSPLIWRRLLVRGDTSVADLHATLQAALGWRDEHLHRFIIQRRCYGDGGHSNPRRVRLSDLGLRERERFRYEYDFSDGWQHDLRVEQILSPEPGRTYPRCTGGQRAAPPEDCGGPWAFLELHQHYSAGRIATRLVAIFESLVSDQRYGRELVDDLDEDDREAKAQELEELVRWLRIDRFDRRAVNRQLAQFGQTASRAAA
jgi:Plasmid pRiA4b ORF-3-like protein